MSKNDGGQAFPCQFEFASGDREYHYGVSVRDKFAGDFLIGLISHFGAEDAEKAAELAYEYADAMIKERDK